MTPYDNGIVVANYLDKFGAGDRGLEDYSIVGFSQDLDSVIVNRVANQNRYITQDTSPNAHNVKQRFTPRTLIRGVLYLLSDHL